MTTATFNDHSKLLVMNHYLDITSLPSKFSVKETIDKLETVFRSKGITIYGRIDQQAEAEKAGLQLKPMELLLFGNPKAGIPLILHEPLCALDLPLKVLAWEGMDGKVWLSYNNFAYLQRRFALPDNLINNVSGAEAVIKNTLESK
jgi:uncharacterized protein (DUF302 family)